MHFPDDEPTCELVSAFDFDFEIYSLKKEDYKDLIYDEIMLYHDDEAVRSYDSNKKHYPQGMLYKVYSKERVKKRF